MSHRWTRRRSALAVPEAGWRAACRALQLLHPPAPQGARWLYVLFIFARFFVLFQCVVGLSRSCRSGSLTRASRARVAAAALLLFLSSSCFVWLPHAYYRYFILQAPSPAPAARSTCRCQGGGTTGTCISCLLREAALLARRPRALRGETLT